MLEFKWLYGKAEFGLTSGNIKSLPCRKRRLFLFSVFGVTTCAKDTFLLQLIERKKYVTAVGSIGKEQCKMPRHWLLVLPSPKGKCSLWRTALHLDIIWLGGSNGTRIWYEHSLVVCQLLFRLCSQHWPVSWEWLTVFHVFEKLQAADVWMQNLPTKYVSFICLCNLLSMKSIYLIQSTYLPN